MTVTDAGGGSASQTYCIVVNPPLVVTSPSSPPIGAVGEAYAGTSFSASGGSGTYTWRATNLPPGLTIGATGAITGTPTGSSNTYTVTATAKDSNGITASNAASIQINATLAVTCLPNPLPAASLGETYAGATCTASGGVGTYTYSASTAFPSGININSSSGAVSGTPTVSGGFSPVVKVTDSNGGTFTQSLSLTVNGALSITASGTLPQATVGVAYSGSPATATGGSGGIAWSATSLPPGLTINSSTGVISGTPTSNSGSPYSVTVTVTDGAGSSASVPLSLIVVAPTVYTISAVNSTVTAAPGETAIFTLQVTPAGYPGQIMIPNLGNVSCTSPYGGEVGSSLGNGPTWVYNPDGTISVQVGVNLTAGSDCATYSIALPVWGYSPSISQTGLPLSLTLNVQTSATLSMYATLLSQTAVSATYMVDGYANFTDSNVTLDLDGQPCAYRIGHPLASATGTQTQTVGFRQTISVGTLGCPPGGTQQLWIKGTGGGTTGTTSVGLYIPPTQTVMLSPPPGTTVPGGATTFTWQPGPGVAECMLSVGSVQGAGDYYAGGAQACASGAVYSQVVSVPANAPGAYATLNSLTAAGWQTQSYSYTVNPAPGTQALQLVGTQPMAKVPANGQEMQFVYQFSAGDARTVTGVRVSGVPVSARIAAATAGTVTVGYTAAQGAAATQGTVNLDYPGGTVQAQMETDGGANSFDIVSVSTTETTVGSLVNVWVEGFGYFEEGMGDDVTLALCDDSGNGCMTADEQGLTGALAEMTFTSQSPGAYCLVVSTADYWESEEGDGSVSTPPWCWVTFLPAGGPPPPAVTTISYNGSTVASSAPGVSCVSPACSVVVGQQVTLTGSPSGGSWSIGGTIYSQWNGQDGNAPAAADLTSNPVSFFWVAGGGFTVSYSAGGSSASATFSVAAPSVSEVKTTFENPFIGFDAQNNPFLAANLEVKATVTPPPGAPSGTISWAQVIPSDAGALSGGGLKTESCSFPVVYPFLDGSNPYANATNSGNNTDFQDEPDLDLASIQAAGYTLVTRQASFNLYLMWQPTVPTASFAVPVEVFNWGINAGASFANGAWTANGTTTPPTPSPAVAYPTWKSVKAVGLKYNCSSQ
jgi:hypothetical protein